MVWHKVFSPSQTTRSRAHTMSQVKSPGLCLKNGVTLRQSKWIEAICCRNYFVFTTLRTLVKFKECIYSVSLVIPATNSFKCLTGYFSLVLTAEHSTQKILYVEPNRQVFLLSDPSLQHEVTCQVFLEMIRPSYVLTISRPSCLVKPHNSSVFSIQRTSLRR